MSCALVMGVFIDQHFATEKINTIIFYTLIMSCFTHRYLSKIDEYC